MYALIDGDILTYRIGFSCNEDDQETAEITLDGFLEDLLENIGAEDYELFLTGQNNFRKDYATTAPYKGNRKGERPVHYDALRDHMVEAWDALIVEGEEADDAIAYTFEALKKTDKDPVIVSIDKDFDQLSGKHYNPVKHYLYNVSEQDALLNFYMQFLVGDRIDNIIGVRGIGQVKARKLLEGKTEEEMYAICVEKLGSKERAIENGILLNLRRYKGQIWSPPDEANEEKRTEGV